MRELNKGNPTVLTMEENSTIKQIIELIDEKLSVFRLEQKSIMTVDDLSEYLGLQPSYIRKMTHNREIPYYKPNGKKLYFQREEIDEWILSSRVATAEELRSEARRRVKKL